MEETDDKWLYVQLIIGILVCAGNTVILIVIRKYRSFSKSTRFMLANLALADLMIGLAIFFRPILTLVGVFDTILCRVWCFFITIAGLASFGSLCVTSVYNFFLASHPVMNPGTKYIYIVESCTWVFSVVLSSILWAFPGQPHGPQCAIPYNYFLTDVYAIYYIFLELMMLAALACQLATTRALLKRQSAISTLTGGQPRARQMDNSKNR